MKNYSNYFLALMLFIGFASCSKQKDLPLQNTYKVDVTDSDDEIIAKAAHVVPTENQLNALKNEFIAFIHIGPNTFTRMEWGNGKEDPKIFDLKELDTDQWCEAMASAGMKMVIITVKHHDGFVLWQSRYTDHGIMSTNFRNGKGDILKDLSESCKKYNLKLGIYLSPADLYQIESPNGLYGNESKYTKRVIPRPVEGRPFENKTTFEFELDDYNEYFMNQLFEVLTEYGPVHEVWFDGAHPKRKGGQTYNYQAWKELIHKLAPKAVIFGREDIRWCGNESGATRNTEWNVLVYPENPNEMNTFSDIEGEDLGSRNVLLTSRGKYLHYQPTEVNTSIREGWFYRDDTAQKVRSADDVFDIYERAVGGNSIFLLNIPPNRDGKFSSTDVKVLHEVGERIRETYGTDLLAGASGPKELLDNDLSTFVEVKPSQSVEFKLDKPITINRIVIQEDIKTHGERIEEHAVDAWIDGKWEQIALATNVGYKRILRFPDVTTDKLKVRVLAARATSAIATVSAHFYKSHPPMLDWSRSKDGKVTLSAKNQEFNWKPHGEDSSKNLNAGFKIYYTTNGKNPTTSDQLYTEPFALENATLKAVAVLNDELGTILSEEVGYMKNDWTLVQTTAKDPKADSSAIFDENPKSSVVFNRVGTKPIITIDLGKETALKSFSYTPDARGVKNLMAKGDVLVSNDNKTWTKVGTFDFGNLINDPTKRFYEFAKPVSAKHVAIANVASSDHGDSVAISEIDFY